MQHTATRIGTVHMLDRSRESAAEAFDAARDQLRQIGADPGTITFPEYDGRPGAREYRIHADHADHGRVFVGIIDGPRVADVTVIVARNAADLTAGDSIPTACGWARIAHVEHVGGRVEVTFEDDIDPTPMPHVTLSPCTPCAVKPGR